MASASETRSFPQTIWLPLMKSPPQEKTYKQAKTYKPKKIQVNPQKPKQKTKQYTKNLQNPQKTDKKKQLKPCQAMTSKKGKNITQRPPPTFFPQTTKPLQKQKHQNRNPKQNTKPKTQKKTLKTHKEKNNNIFQALPILFIEDLVVVQMEL